MFKMLSILWAALGSFFSAFEKFGSALNHLGGWAEEAAAAIADEARMERQQKLAVLSASLRATNSNIAATEAAAATPATKAKATASSSVPAI